MNSCNGAMKKRKFKSESLPLHILKQYKKLDKMEVEMCNENETQPISRHSPFFSHLTLAPTNLLSVSIERQILPISGISHNGII